jgi:hypothetical protein
VIPPPAEALTENSKLREVSGNGVVSVVTQDDLLDPFTDRRSGIVHSVA